jgi:hypothetical protein
MTIAIKPTASGSTIEQNGSTILTVDGSGNITPSNQLYPKVPAFSAYVSSNQSLAHNTFTKITYDIEHFDTNSNYDNATNYRFTPTVAGYYQFNIRAELSTDYVGDVYVALFKNGSRIHVVGSRQDQENQGVGGSALVYANGSTDYFEGYMFHTIGSSVNTSNYAQGSHFQGFLVSV